MYFYFTSGMLLMFMQMMNNKYVCVFSGFCKALKRDSDKVVMVYSVEIYDSMYSTQWFNGEKLCNFQV